MKNRGLALVLAAALAAVLGAGGAFAQENVAAIIGRVADNTGSPVVGAEVRIVNADTGVEARTLSNEVGNYIAPGLPPGRYRLSADHTGFKRFEVSDVLLDIQQQKRVDVRLEVGEVHEVVSVVATPPQLVTDDATLGQVVDSTNAVELPLLNRNPAELALIGPGVMNASASSINGIVSNIFTGSVAVSANGMRPSANQYSIDGGNANVGLYNYPSLLPMPDAIGESIVRTGNYSAEYGGFGGAHIDYVLKSGTNRYHGSAWDFLSNDALNARDTFAIAKPVYRQNQFGGVVSGPVIRNKTFFMLGYQGLRLRQQQAVQTNVPTADQAAGNLQFNTTGGKVAAFKDPTTNAPFANNLIPASRISPTMAKVLQLYPAPNTVGSPNYRRLVNTPVDNDMVLVKVDQSLGQDRVSFRYSIQKSTTVYTVPVLSDFGIAGHNTGQNAGASGTHIFSPTTILDLRLSWNRFFLQNESPRNGTSFDARQTFGMVIPSSAGPGTPENGIPNFSLGSFGAVGDIASGAPLIQPDDVYQAASGLTSVHGRHTLKFGTDLRRTRSSRFRTLNTAGAVAFANSNPAGTGYDVADFLLGLPNTANITTNPITVDFRQWRADFYISDSWTVTPRLTLSLGLRYEFNSPLGETGGRIPFFNLTAPGSFAVQPKGEELFDADYTNFAPRFGFAYRLGSSTVLRGGYGIFYSDPKLLGMDNLAVNPPLVTQYAFTSSVAAPLKVANAFPIGVLLSGGVPSPSAVQHNAATPYVQTVSFNVQRAFGKMVAEVGYVGNTAVHMFRAMQLNVPTPGAGSVQPRRPLPNWGPITYIQADSNSNYHSLQTRLQRRFASGLSLIASYTFSKSIDLAPDEQQGGTIDPSNLNRDRSLSDFYQKHRLTVSLIYQLPFGPGKPFLKSGIVSQAARGWQISGINTFMTGTPITITTSATPANAGLNQSRPNRICDGNIPGGGTRQKWFDTSCFVVPTAFNIGNAGRNVILAPGVNNWNLGLTRTFVLHEQHSLRFRADMFNAWNHVNPTGPGSTVGGALFGQITAAAPARRIQASLKYTF